MEIMNYLNTQENSSAHQGDGKYNDPNNNVQRIVRDERPPKRDDDQEKDESLPSVVRNQIVSSCFSVKLFVSVTGVNPLPGLFRLKYRVLLFQISV